MWPLQHNRRPSSPVCKLMIVRTVVFLAGMTVIFHFSFYVLESGNKASCSDASDSTTAAAAEDAGYSAQSLFLDTLTFIQRKERMNEMCRTYAGLHRNSFESTGDLDHILVDEKHKLLYCYVPKVACTNWKRVFFMLLGKSGVFGYENASSIPAEVVHKKTTFPKLSDYSEQRAKHFVANFTKYLFVRHPFERLLSAFRNKLERPLQGSKYFQLRIGRNIVKHYRMNATEHSQEYGDDVTFEEFAMYLVDHYVPAFNEHWKPISELCYPCLIKYDFIGKYETLQSDAEFLLRAVNRSEIKFPRVRVSNTTSQVAKYYNALPPHIIARLYNIFILDFKLFGYSTENILGYEIG